MQIGHLGVFARVQKSGSNVLTKNIQRIIFKIVTKSKFIEKKSDKVCANLVEFRIHWGCCGGPDSALPKGPWSIGSLSPVGLVRTSC